MPNDPTTQLAQDENAGGLPIVRHVADLRARIADWRREGQEIALVPTMGSLHAGHMALVQHALNENRRVVATIFVNPKQFDRPEDLSRYPRREAEDAEMLARSGADLLFAPDVSEMYPDGFKTRVTVESLPDCLCGAHRPGHFDGVATVVSKLLLQSLPDRAYFGEKDFQQLQIVRRMVRDLDVPTEIRPVPTVREEDGLALSSRNRALSPEQRAIAPHLHGELSQARRMLAEERAPVADILADARARLLEAGFDNVDYFELRAADTLEPLSQARLSTPARLFAAAWLGSTRLIDNLPAP